MLHGLLGRLGWPPDAVWRATPREVALALGLPARAEPMRAEALRRLMRAFPDD